LNQESETVGDTSRTLQDEKVLLQQKQNAHEQGLTQEISLWQSRTTREEAPDRGVGDSGLNTGASPPTFVNAHKENCKAGPTSPGSVEQPPTDSNRPAHRPYLPSDLPLVLNRTARMVIQNGLLTFPERTGRYDADRLKSALDRIGLAPKPGTTTIICHFLPGAQGGQVD
jgi:hypothetical protein